ncbi:MAG: hypothetical protein H0W88_07435 [Parachlamydiaceae bacterium]|nr:hypothetical protein [Parachlamydiaceae bacterium]
MDSLNNITNSPFLNSGSGVSEKTNLTTEERKDELKFLLSITSSSRKREELLKELKDLENIGLLQAKRPPIPVTENHNNQVNIEKKLKRHLRHLGDQLGGCKKA